MLRRTDRTCWCASCSLSPQSQSSNIPSVAIEKESNATLALANCSFRDIGASLPSSLEEDEELEESSELLLSFLASLQFPDAATSLDFSDAASWDLTDAACSDLTKEASLEFIGAASLEFTDAAMLKDNEQVALQAEEYTQKYIIRRTVFVHKFEKWLANHYLGHLLKFFDQEEGQSVVERWIATNQPSSSRFVAKSWKRTMSPGTAILFGSKPKTGLMLAPSVQSIFHTKVALVASIAPNGVHLHCNVLHGDFFPVWMQGKISTSNSG